MRLPFRIVNVFTVDGDRLSGNPLCVFEDASGLSTEQMQALARQLNLSETTFVLPGDRVRIFTPGFEMPFAGHPTLGTASVVARGRERVELELDVGRVEVVATGATWTLRAAKAPVTRAAAPRDELAAMLGVPESAIAGKPLWVDTGVEQLVIPIASAEHVRAAKPALRGDDDMAYLWAPDGTVRFFFTQHGAVIEDPATGSAAANLGGYFVATERALPVEMTLRQGDAVHRPSRLTLRVDEERSIFVGGEVIELGSGTFEL